MSRIATSWPPSSPLRHATSDCSARGTAAASLVAEAAAITGLPRVAECCDRLYAPVGLDLGGERPEAIALAVIAEAQACCMGKLGASRRLSAADVAAQLAEGGASRYLQAHCALDQPA